ncbi:MAG: hypothetical protein HY916_09290 [Desulfovibrio sp.]|jgi:hypothetical protein|nr:hypothetical protein [Desulfovibrio sp.]
MSSLNEAIRSLHVQLLRLMQHPEVSGQDKASIVLAGTHLAEIEKRHMPHAMRGSMSCPNTRGFAPVPGLDPGWMLRRERAEEVADA